MAMPEIDSFIWKFKKLLHSGMNAKLEIKSEAGKAVVTLTAEVDVHPQHRVQSRNGPSRQRRREKRAAEREAAANEEAVQVVEEKPAVDKTANEIEFKTAGKAIVVLTEESKEAGKALVSEGGRVITEKVNDEICPNEEYRSSRTKSNLSAQELRSKITSVDYYSLTYEDMSDPD